MAIAVERDDARCRFRATASGVITASELRDFIASVRVGEYGRYSLLFDGRGARVAATTVELNALSEQIRRLAQAGERRGPVGIVFSDDASFGMGRMYETIVELVAGIDTIRVFRTVTEAETWLQTRERAS